MNYQEFKTSDKMQNMNEQLKYVVNHSYSDTSHLLAVLREDFLDLDALSHVNQYDVLGEVVSCPKHVVYYTALYVEMLQKELRGQHYASYDESTSPRMREMLVLLRENAEEETMLAELRGSFLDVYALREFTGFDVEGEMMASPHFVMYYAAVYLELLKYQIKRN